jgi:hypothetical protein
MTAIDRRTLMRGFFGVAVAAGGVATLGRRAAEAMPLGTLPANAPDPLVQEAQWGPPPRHRHPPPPRHRVGPPPHHWHHRPRQRRWVCWWNRGRRICGWR